MIFLKKAVKFGGGVILAQLITAASIPFLSRIYSPEEFSLFGLYFSISAILVVFVTLKLETLLPKEENIQEKLPAVITVAIMTFFPLIAIAFLILTIISNDIKIINIFWAFSIVLASVTFNLFNIINILNVRKNQISKVNVSRVSRSIFSIIFQGLLYSVKGGLFLGEILGRFFGLIMLSKRDYYKINFSDSKKLIKDKINYIKYVVSSNLFNTLGLNIYPIIVLMFYDPILIGKFFFVQKLLSAPVTIFAQSISISILGDFNKIIRINKEKLIKKLHIISLIFFLVSLVIFFIFGFFLKYWEVYLFGNDWEGIYKFVFILIPFLVGQIAFSPFSQILILVGGEKKQFFWDISRLILIFISIFIPLYIGSDNGFLLSLMIYSIVNFFMYIIHYSLLVTSISRFQHD